MKILSISVALLLATPAVAQTTSSTLDVQSGSALRTREASPFTNNPARPTLESIRVNGRALNAEETRRLLERSLQNGRAGGGGGDDVGNGGDELRQEFLELAHATLNEAGDAVKDQLQATLGIRRIMVVNGLQVQSGTESVTMRAVVSEGVILLDAQAWDPSNGLLSLQHDPRLEMLRLMNSAAGSPLIEASIMQAWNRLSPRAGRIWCPLYQTRQGESRTKREFTLMGLNAQATEDALMSLCQSQRLADCRMSKVITRGSGRYEITVTGYEIRMGNKSRADLQRERCEAARSCETAYDWAPRGQISPADFSALSNEIERTCR